MKPQKAIGKGGEADVYDIGGGKALKVFKSPSHPDYQGSPLEQQAACDRLREHQQKLRQFPAQLPDRVVRPEALATDQQGQILGYTMPFLRGTEVLLRYGDRGFRQTGIPQQTVVQIFQDLYQTVAQLHQAQVVIGDFNDLNVLVLGHQAHLIDADSFQFGKFLARVFTARFVDPLLCDAPAHQLILQAPHTPDSDWYAFTVMLMQCLLFVHPYGGVYQPKDPAQRLPHDLRPLHRITIFHPQVKYPKPALPYHCLPDGLLHHFHQVFEHNLRGQFPRSLLDNLHWNQCPTCGLEYARPCCPNCAQMAPGTVKEMTRVRGTVVATQVFVTQGVILQAALSGEQLCWLFHDRGAFRRETDQAVLTGDLNPQLQFWLQGAKTWVGQQGQVVALTSQGVLPGITVERCGLAHSLAVNQDHAYWINNGQLLRNGHLGPHYIGDVLTGQTRFWMGSQFGFGFYQAANLRVAFVFDRQQQGLNDRVQLPRWQGQLMEVTCTFSDRYCWVLTATQEQGKQIHRCTVIGRDGVLLGAIAAEPGGDQSWLTTLQGKCAVDNFLLAATDQGIVRVELHQGQLTCTKEFPDTEPFVDSSSQLFATSQGLYIVNRRQIQFLKLAKSSP
ncbi:hypothetical protein [Neosynechococcus sphagnicola]|uniref:hypothetical protein n=1 Tax=Neosynechococcus sphagnicola TaxID=1501145 RepID=UPI000A3FDCD6|nr:hypothetical protein [Neosynechococcus sphagnicola]